MHFGAGLLVICAVVICAIFISWLVILNDARTLLSRLFLAVIGVSTVWSVLSILSFNLSSNSARLTSDLATALSYLLVVTCFLFSEVFARERLAAWVRWGLIPVSVPLIVIFGLRYTCGALNSLNNCTGSPSYTFMIVLITGLFVLIVRNCLDARHDPSHVKARQADAMLWGLATGIAVGVLCGYVMPMLGVATFNQYYSLVPLIFIFFTLYAILKHRMFNVRLVIARSIAYLTTLVVLATVYGFLVFGTASIVFNLHISVLAQASISAATVLAALWFSRLKGFFDRISNRLFYRDAYNAEELLDNLNRLFVNYTDLEPLLRSVANMLAESLHAEFVFFSIKASESRPGHTIGSRVGRPNTELVDLLCTKVPNKFVVIDELGDGYEQLRGKLQISNVAIVARLNSMSDRSAANIGYLVLGTRRSGNPYASSDLRTVEIIVNELVIAIENSLRFEEIQRFNQTLQQSVNEATRNLRRTNEKLRTLDETKDDFITMASHQLRTPLTSVKGYISMVLEGDVGDLNEQQRKFLTQSFISSQRMVYLISDLLNLSRLNTGKFVIENSPVNLDTVIKSEIDQLKETAISREVALTYQSPENFPTLMLDETKIHQVVMNFLDNAIYYTPPGGHITVELRETPVAVEYRVIDDGIGVPRSEQRHLFSKFYRANNAKRARPDGTGLGLFMAKKVIAAQGGSVIFESQEGKGSTFGFRFAKHGREVSA